MNTATILALDISSTSIGVCYNGEPHATLKLKGDDIAARCWQAETWIHERIHELGDIDLIAVERPAGRHARALIQMARISGAMLTSVYETGIVWVEISPSDAKKVLTGKGNASKDDMIRVAQQRFGRILDEHQADAYGVWLAARALPVVAELAGR